MGENHRTLSNWSSRTFLLNQVRAAGLLVDLPFHLIIFMVNNRESNKLAFDNCLCQIFPDQLGRWQGKQLFWMFAPFVHYLLAGNSQLFACRQLPISDNCNNAFSQNILDSHLCSTLMIWESHFLKGWLLHTGTNLKCQRTYVCLCWLLIWPPCQIACQPERCQQKPLPVTCRSDSWSHWSDSQAPRA